MGGTNPYVEEDEVALPTRPYKVRFLPVDTVVEVDPAKLPYTRDGKVGSLLEIALGHDVDIDHACGGVCACSTCHVILREGIDSCNEPSDDELDQLDNAPGQEVNSEEH
jgi:2Fe-2S ferredoxin